MLQISRHAEKELAGKNTQQLIASEISRMEKVSAFETLVLSRLKIKNSSAGRLVFANAALRAADCR